MNPPRCFHVDVWLVEPRLGRISRSEPDGKRHVRQLPPKVMDVLVALAGEPGEVLSKDDLRQAVWNGAFVTEDVVRQAVFQLRKALEDDPDAPRFIATLPRRGYRLIARVDHTAPAAVDERAFAADLEIAPDPASPATPAAESSEPGATPRSAYQLYWAAAGLLLACVAGIRFLLPLDGSGGTAGAGFSEVVPLTTLPGLEVEPALSPDGERVAFVHVPPAEADAANSRDGRYLCVLRLGADAEVRLNDVAARISSPTWSPAGLELAYIRYGEDRSEILVHSFASGVDRVLAGWTDIRIGALGWSPRGDRMAMSVGERRDQPAAIHLLDLASLELRRRTSPPAGSVGDILSAWSPDGKWLAFVRRQVRGVEDVFVASAAGGTARRLTHLAAKIPALAWSADGASLILSRYDGAVHGLWRLSLEGELMALPRYGVHPVKLSVAPGRWVFSEFSFDANLHFVDPRAPQERHRPPVASTVWDASPDISADGSRLAFSSDRSGFSEIWTADPDGGNPVRHTDFGGPLTTHPRFSPDGRYLAFDSRGEGNADIFVVSTGFDEPRRLTRHGADDLRPTWSRDGKTLYFASNRSDAWEIWQLPVDGGEARQLTTDGGMFAVEDLDGSALLYSKPDRPGLWRLPPGGEPELRIESLPVGCWGNWALSQDAVFFVRRESDGEHWLVRFDREHHTVERLRRLRGRPENPGLAVATSGRFLIYAMVDRVESDLRLVRGH